MKCTGFRFLIFGRFSCMAMLLLPGVSGLAQDYSYDASGNLSNDGNKQIRSIHYNYMNLADTITYDDGRKIIYMYSASGQKLREQVIDAGGRKLKKMDYVSHFLYNNDSLRQIFQGNGRVVPILVGNLASPWEYQYGQTDLVGNVRALLTSRQDVDNDMATFETANRLVEQNRFQRYDETRLINSILFDHTNNGSTHYSERLNGSANEKYGLAKSISVMPGDVVNLDVFAKYTDPDRSHWQDALVNLITQIANGTAQLGTVVDGSGYLTNGSTTFPMTGLNGTSTSTGPGPKAYLNWLVFDRNFVFKNGGYVRMTDKAKEDGSIVDHEQLSAQLTIKEPGYVYVYLSNEETSPVDVFFDDLTVELVKGPIVQETDYDPFGLAVIELNGEHAEPNNFLFNGKELQKDFDLNWYDYGARMYDAALGRWHVSDSKAEKYSCLSPYNYVMNNPVAFDDPDGKDARLVIDKEARIAYIEANYYVFRHDMDLAVAAVGNWGDQTGKETISINGANYKLGFSLTVIGVSGDDPERLADADPIGNSIEFTTKLLYNKWKGTVAAGVTDVNHVLVTIGGDAKVVAHEMGHTMLNLGDNDHEDGTIMDAADIGIENTINKNFVQKVRQSYGIVKNPYPKQTSTVRITRRDGTVETSEVGGERLETTIIGGLPTIEDFRKLNIFRIFNESYR
jgi:RHS repeat-associated protein